MSSKPSSPRRPNVDVATAAHAVIAALPAIAAYRDRAARLTEFDICCFDTLATTATNALEASRYLDDVRTRADLGVDPSASLAASLRLERDALRRVLATDSTAGDMAARVIEFIPTARSDKELAREVRDLCKLDQLRLSMATTALPDDVARIARATDLATQLDALYRHGSSQTNADAGVQCRDTAFARLVTQYSEVRRAIEYLRPREIELNTIAPSLYEKHGTKSRTRNATFG